MITKFRRKDGTSVNALYEKRVALPNLHPKDTNLTVPADGREYVQVLWDEDVLGCSRQEYNNVKGDFDFPMLANPAHYGTKRVYPGFSGKVYSYVSAHDSIYKLQYDLMRYMSNGALEEESKIKYWYEKKKNKITGRKLFSPPTPSDFLDTQWFASVEPETSLMAAYSKVMEDGVAITDAGNRETGDIRCPVSGWSAWAKKNMPLLTGLFSGALIPVRSYGSYWSFPVIDITKEAPQLGDVLAQGLYLWCTAGARTKRTSDGRLAVSDFPMLSERLRSKNLPPVGVPYLTLGIGKEMWIPKRVCSPILTPGTRWSPYRKMW
jgi:hypothetical protein